MVVVVGAVRLDPMVLGGLVVIRNSPWVEPQELDLGRVGKGEMNNFSAKMGSPRVAVAVAGEDTRLGIPLAPEVRSLSVLRSLQPRR